MNCDIDLSNVTLSQGHDAFVKTIINIEHESKKLWVGHRFWLCGHSDLDLGDMTLGQGNDTPLGHGQQLYEISPRSKMEVRSYGVDTDVGYVYAVTLTLDL